LLCALATRGLVATDGTRWSIHDAVRRHGVRGLAGAGEEDATRRRHLEWALAVPEEGIGDRANVLAAKAWAASRRA
jgi:hypothetical protein